MVPAQVRVQEHIAEAAVIAEAVGDTPEQGQPAEDNLRASVQPDSRGPADIGLAVDSLRAWVPEQGHTVAVGDRESRTDL